AAAKLVDEALQKNLTELKGLPVKELVTARYDKFRKMARFFTEQ
ncbi:MAG: acetyl-CoA carboxylase carboxyl transferase subunit alpha, partial [Acidobacteria bacterium]